MCLRPRPCVLQVDGVMAVQLAAEIKERDAQAAAQAAAAKEREENSLLGRVSKGLATLRPPVRSSLQRPPCMSLSLSLSLSLRLSQP